MIQYLFDSPSATNLSKGILHDAFCLKSQPKERQCRRPRHATSTKQKTRNEAIQLQWTPMYTGLYSVNEQLFKERET